MPPRSSATTGMTVDTASASKATRVMVRTRPPVRLRRPGDHRLSPGPCGSWAGAGWVWLSDMGQVCRSARARPPRTDVVERTAAHDRHPSMSLDGPRCMASARSPGRPWRRPPLTQPEAVTPCASSASWRPRSSSPPSPPVPATQPHHPAPTRASAAPSMAPQCRRIRPGIRRSGRFAEAATRVDVVGTDYAFSDVGTELQGPVTFAFRNEGRTSTRWSSCARTTASRPPSRSSWPCPRTRPSPRSSSSARRWPWPVRPRPTC